MTPARCKLGLDFYLGRKRQLGFSIDLVVDRHELGPVDSSSPSNYVQVSAPAWMLRVTGFWWLFPHPV